MYFNITFGQWFIISHLKFPIEFILENSFTLPCCTVASRNYGKLYRMISMSIGCALFVLMVEFLVINLKRNLWQVYQVLIKDLKTNLDVFTSSNSSSVHILVVPHTHTKQLSKSKYVAFLTRLILMKFDL